MEWVVITSSSFFEGEVSFIRLLLRCGVNLVHLRKPESTAEQCATVLGRLTTEERRRVVVHQHFQQAVDYGLHGIHLNRRNPKPLPGYGGSISRSCHSMEEVSEWKPHCQYVFLSPIFNSISKHDYKATFSAGELARAAAEGLIDGKVFALGGIAPEHIPALKAWRFGGAAMLGHVNKLVSLPIEDAEKELLKIKELFANSL